MHDVGQKVVVAQAIVQVDLVVVDGQSAVQNTPFVFLDGMSAKLPAEHLEDLLADPTALCERGEGEVIRINLPQAVLHVVGRLVVAVVGEAGPFGL